MNYLARFDEWGRVQTLPSHLVEVGDLAYNKGKKLGIGNMCRLAGILHDLGKYKLEFQEYLERARLGEEVHRGEVHHALEGAVFLDRFIGDNLGHYGRLLVEVLSNVIMSHHSDMNDHINSKGEEVVFDKLRCYDGDLIKVGNLFFNEVISEVEFASLIDLSLQELEIYISSYEDDYNKGFYLLTRYIYGVLISSDWENSESLGQYMFEGRSNFDYIEEFSGKIERQAKYFKENPKGKLSKLQNGISEMCRVGGLCGSGEYRLTVPTGGGKTLSSLRYALTHAKEHGKERIIYIVPYTTIIEQNVGVVRGVLGKEGILEYHSNVTEREFKFIRDDWSEPIIYTTMVQYLDIFYSNSKRSARRIDRLANSVIIFDEVQKVPVRSLKLFNASVDFLVNHCGSTVLRCTATQPEVRGKELIKDVGGLYEGFRRVRFTDKAFKGMSKAELTSLINLSLSKESLLVILNTKRAVKDLYRSIKEEGNWEHIYNLTTDMCPVHRTEVLDRVRKELGEGKKVLCISTSLIEAGVDISFGKVIRSMVGLDSILQSAGRCNRRGEVLEGEVVVIDYNEEYVGMMEDVVLGGQVTKLVLKRLREGFYGEGKRLDDIEIIEDYFSIFYARSRDRVGFREDGIDLYDLLMVGEGGNNYFSNYVNQLLRSGETPNIFCKGSYREANKRFRVIDSLTGAVIVDYEKGKELIESLRELRELRLTFPDNYDMVEEVEKIEKQINKKLRGCQGYQVNIFKKKLEEMLELGLVEDLGFAYVINEGVYQVEFGVDY